MDCRHFFFIVICAAMAAADATAMAQQAPALPPPARRTELVGTALPRLMALYVEGPAGKSRMSKVWDVTLR
jgi:hypothetical protein